MMGLKIVAALAVVGAALGLGRLAARPYRARVLTLEAFQRVMRRMEPLMVRHRLPLPSALIEASRAQPLLFPAMQSLVDGLGDPDASLASLWDHMLEGLLGLWEDDRAVLRDFGRVLGKTDAEAQRTELAAVMQDLSRLTLEARRHEAQDGRLYPALISAMGVMVVILLL